MKPSTEIVFWFSRVPSILISFLEVMCFDHKKHRTSVRACTIASKCLKIGFSRSKNRIFPFTVDWWSMLNALILLWLLRNKIKTLFGGQDSFYFHFISDSVSDDYPTVTC